MNINQASEILELKNTFTLDDVKKAYRNKAKQYHPDKSGDTEMMQVINSAYAYFKQLDSESFTVEETEHTNICSKMQAAINAVILLKDVEIEICGLWIWLSGDTKQHKDIIKEAGYFWAHKKKMWYFRASESKKTYRSKEQSIDDIRSKYGSQRAKADYSRFIAA